MSVEVHVGLYCLVLGRDARTVVTVQDVELKPRYVCAHRASSRCGDIKQREEIRHVCNFCI